MSDHAEPKFGGLRSARRLHADLDSHSAAVAPLLTSHLQDHARSQGWDDEAVGHLYVAYQDGGFHPRYHPDGKDAVETLEYGNLNQRPNPAMRTWALQSHEYASDIHDAALVGALHEELF